MKKFLLSGAVFFSALSFSQQNWCGFDAQNAQLNLENPGREQLIHERISLANDFSMEVGDRTLVIIPVVVHVIHDGGESNISDAQVLSGIEMLNEDFNRLNVDTIDTRNTGTAPFLPVAAEVGIEFRLAKIDPDGNCTNGIERRYSPSAANNADNGAKHYSSGGLDAWDRNKYMNIWIVNSIASDGGGVTLGYAEFPYSGGSSNYGLIIRHDAYGSIGTSNTGERTVTHEIGHCLGLFHTFQGGCHADDCSDNGDYCCDTPPESEAHWSCGLAQNSCSDIPTNDLYGFDALDQWENFMSYAPCQNMFSVDQMNIMLFNLSDITFLANLTSAANQAATGVLDPEELCKADFSSGNTVICSGSSIQFYDQSFFNVTGRTWTFGGGTPATSTDINPVITFNTAGVYSVTLEVTDGVSTQTQTKSAYVTVLPSDGQSLPYSEGFENFPTFPGQEFFLQNDGGQGWNITSTAAYGGDQSLKLKNYAEPVGTKDAFMSGTIDLSGVDPADDIVFNFRYAYKKRNTGNDEWLRFYISKDCGETWSLRKNLHGSTLGTLTQSFPYTPGDTSEWTFVSVTNINSDYYVANFRYKFEFENDNGNNIYIDNINLYPESMLKLEEDLSGGNKLSVFPNPAVDHILISYEPENVTACTITILDALGQTVALVYEGSLQPGENTLAYSAWLLSPGIYFVQIQTDNTTETVKFIKQ